MNGAQSWVSKNGPLLVSVLVLLGAGVGQWVATSSRITTLEARTEAHYGLDAHKGAGQSFLELRHRITVTEAKAEAATKSAERLDDISVRLARLETKLDSLLEKNR